MGAWFKYDVREETLNSDGEVIETKLINQVWIPMGWDGLQWKAVHKLFPGFKLQTTGEDHYGEAPKDGKEVITVGMLPPV